MTETTERKALINRIVFTVGQLKPVPSASDSLSEWGSATGFFYESNDKLFLVTCKHVLIDPEEKHEPKELLVRLHLAGTLDLRQNGILKIPLYDSKGNPIWIQHNNDEIDLALVKLDKEWIKSEYDIDSFSSRNRFPADFLVVPSDDVFLIGYPLGLYDKANNLPIFRHATIASYYGVPYGKEERFLTDGKLHPGMSGAPIVTNPKAPLLDRNYNFVFRSGEKYFLLGVHCAGDKEHQDLELGYAWYAKLIDEIIEENSKSVGKS